MKSLAVPFLLAASVFGQATQPQAEQKVVPPPAKDTRPPAKEIPGPKVPTEDKVHYVQIDPKLTEQQQAALDEVFNRLTQAQKDVRLVILQITVDNNLGKANFDPKSGRWYKTETVTTPATK